MQNRFAPLALLLCCFVCLMAQTVLAHEGRPVYVEVQQTTDTLYNLRWKIPPVMEQAAIPRVTLQGDHCQLLSGPRLASLAGGSRYQCNRPAVYSKDSQSLQMLRSENESGLSVVLNYPRSNPALSSLVVFHPVDGESVNLFNGPDKRQINLPNKLGGWAFAKQYMGEGIAHILTGYDHLLFVLCLMYVAGDLRRIILTVTGFTIAHSLTLAAATFALVQVRIDVVEILIALSIVMLAAEIVRAKGRQFGHKPPSLVWRYPASISVIFGLLHGFGFASALGDIGLPQTMKVPALAFFNLGVELGQLTFVFVVIIFLQVIRTLFRSKRFNLSEEASGQGDSVGLSMPLSISVPVSIPISIPIPIIYCVGVLSAYWFIERIIVTLG